MPELSEVEYFRWLLLPLVCTNKEASGPSTCLSIECPSPTPPRAFPTKEELDSLKDYRVTNVLRKGKLLRIDLEAQKKKDREQQLFLFLHMGMTGRISTKSKVLKLESLSDADYPPPHTHLVLKANGHEAAFSDPRRFGKVCLCDPSKDQFVDLAPDALDNPGNLDGIVGQRKGIKALLLDQKAIVSGVGNWIADEVLYRSKIHPDQAYLTEGERDSVRQNLELVLTTSIRCLKEEKDFPNDWLFHRKWKKSASKGETIKDAKGRKVSYFDSGGRSSAVVLAVQKLKKSRSMNGNEQKKKSVTTKRNNNTDSNPSDGTKRSSANGLRKKRKSASKDEPKEDQMATRRSTRRK